MSEVPANTLVEFWHTLPDDAQDPKQTLRPPPPIAGTTAERLLEALKARTEASAGPAGLTMGELLGEGGMGMVHLAQQHALDREVAVKSLKPSYRSKPAILGLLREGWLTGALRHPNVVPVHDLVLDADGTPYVVMERLEGSPWGALLRDNQALKDQHGAQDPLAWHLQVLATVTAAVGHAHSRGILHRDIKPSNVMIGKQGEVWLVDWGIAASVGDGAGGRLPRADQERRIVGTPSYMAPEMLKPGKACLATDVYLIGAVLFEIITGLPPHSARTIEQVEASIQRGLPTLPAACPPPIAALIHACMQLDPEARPSAEQVRVTLKHILDERASLPLLAEASAALNALRALLESEAPSRDALYAQLGACRYTFQRALAQWPNQKEAKAGLTESLTIMAHWELAQRDDEAASRLLAELPEVPPALAARVSALHAENQAASLHLKALQRDADPTIGRRTRLFLAALILLLWTGAPFTMWVTGQEYSPAALAMTSALFVCFNVAFGIWARESMTATSLNRGIMVMIIAAPAGQIFVSSVMGSLPLSFGHQRSLLLIYWGTLTLSFAVTHASVFIPAALFYLGAAIFVAQVPAQGQLMLAVTNLFLGLTAIYAVGTRSSPHLPFWPSQWTVSDASKD